MKRIILSSMLALLITGMASLVSQTQNANISFEKKTHNFGKIKEADGHATYEFSFTNTGNEPLVISRVVASCGCTAPSWTREPVVPGGKGYVKAVFDPKNRPGKFNKSLTVLTNSQEPQVVLRIQGDVDPKPKTIADIYPYQLGQVRLKQVHLPFVKMPKGQVKTLLLEVVNVSDETVEMSFQKVPAHLTMKAPGALKPDQKGVVEVTYDSNKKNDWGFVIDRVDFSLNGASERNWKLSISATLEEDFSMLSSEELANAPVIKFNETTYNFGSMKQRSTVEHDFVFTNSGRSDLVLRNIKSSCGCTAVKPAAEVIKPGESSSIKAIFSSGTRQGKQSKSITVITNDPKSSQVILRVTGTVEKTTSNN